MGGSGTRESCRREAVVRVCRNSRHPGGGNSNTADTRFSVDKTPSRKSATGAFLHGPAGAAGQNDLPKKRGVKTARYCRFERPVNSFLPKNTPIQQDFSRAWTPFPLQPENGIVRLPIRAFYGLFRVSLSPPPVRPFPRSAK